MSRRVRSALVALSAAAVFAAPAQAFWTAAGSGSGSGAAATMPAGNQPTASVASQSVTVAWAQSTFVGGPLGSFTGGGYTVTRYANGGSTPVTPGAACAGVTSGGAASLQCVDAGVPYGAWQYAITPVLSTFTGAQSPKSAVATVTTAAPVVAVAAQNPTAGQSTGSIGVSWTAVTGATGYNVYRAVGAGAYNFASPLNVTATTSYTDPGSGLSPATGYHYVVRATAGSPAVESASSTDASATTITRPAAPAGTPTAVAAPTAHVTVGWTSVAAAVGYNVYRKPSGGSYGATPVNGTTPVSGTTFDDATPVNALSYVYMVRSVITGASGAQVESTDSAPSASVTADGIAPSLPTSVAATSGGNPVTSVTCGVAIGTSFINNATKSAVAVTAVIPAPAAGEYVVFTADTPGSTAVTTTVAAGGTSVPTTMNLGSLLDGVLTLTARSTDTAGNTSATRSATVAIVKDVVAPTAPVANYVALLIPHMTGSTECGATISARRSSDGDTTTFFIASGTTYNFNLPGILLGHYDVTSTDLAGNVSAITVATLL